VIPTNLSIIIADDDSDDQSLLSDALVANGIDRGKIILVSDGEELTNLLPRYAKSPCLVFLDLNMPKKSGLKVLSEVKTNPDLKHIPMLIFTTSSSKSDISSSYQLGGNSYFPKPFSYSELINLVAVIKSYWLDKGILPDYEI